MSAQDSSRIVVDAQPSVAVPVTQGNASPLRDALAEIEADRAKAAEEKRLAAVPAGYEPIEPIPMQGQIAPDLLNLGFSGEQVQAAIEAMPDGERQDMTAYATQNLAKAILMVKEADLPSEQEARKYEGIDGVSKAMVRNLLPHSKNELEALRRMAWIKKNTGVDSYLAGLASGRDMHDKEMEMHGRMEAALLERDGSAVGQAWYNLRKGAGGVKARFWGLASEIARRESDIPKVQPSRLKEIRSSAHETSKWLLNKFGYDAPTDEERDNIEKILDKMDSLNRQRLQERSDYIGNQYRSIKADNYKPELDTGNKVGDFISSAVFGGLPSLGASLGMAAVVGPTGAAAIWASSTAAEVRSDLRDAGVDNGTADVAAGTVGVAFYFLERSQLDRILKMPRSEIGRSLMKYGGAMGQEAGVEAGQNFAQRTGTEVGKWQGGKQSGGETFDKIMSGLLDDAKAGLSAAVLVGGMGMPSVYRGAKAQAEHYRKDFALRKAEEAITAAGADVDAVLVRDQAKLLAADKGAVVQKVYLDPRAMVEKFGQDEAEKQAASMGVSQEAFRAAIGGEHDLEIGAGEWLGYRASNPEGAEAMRGNIRYSSDGPTVGEEQKSRDEMRAIAAEAREFAKKWDEFEARKEVPDAIKAFRSDAIAIGYDSEEATFLAGVLLAGNRRAAARDPGRAQELLNRNIRLLTDRMQVTEDMLKGPQRATVAPVEPAPAVNAEWRTKDGSPSKFKALPAIVGEYSDGEGVRVEYEIIDDGGTYRLKRTVTDSSGVEVSTLYESENGDLSWQNNNRAASSKDRSALFRSEAEALDFTKKDADFVKRKQPSDMAEAAQTQSELGGAPKLTGYNFVDADRNREIYGHIAETKDAAFVARARAQIDRRLAEIEAERKVARGPNSAERKTAREVFDLSPEAIPYEVRKRFGRKAKEPLPKAEEQELEVILHRVLEDHPDSVNGIPVVLQDRFAEFMEQSAWLATMTNKQVKSERSARIRDIAEKQNTVDSGHDAEIDHLEAVRAEIDRAAAPETSPAQRIADAYESRPEPAPMMQAEPAPEAVKVDPLTDPDAEKPWAKEWVEGPNGTKINAGEAAKMLADMDPAVAAPFLKALRGDLARRGYDVEVKEKAVESFAQGPISQELTDQVNAELKAMRESWKADGVDSFAMANKDGVIRLSEIRVPKDKRGQGIGTAKMKELLAVAQKHGLRVALSPSTDFGASSKSRLERFYSSLGFVKNKGRNKDFTISESMIWTPPEILHQSARDRAAAALAKAKADQEALRARVRANLEKAKLLVTPEVERQAMGRYMDAMLRQAAGLEAFAQPARAGIESISDKDAAELLANWEDTVSDTNRSTGRNHTRAPQRIKDLNGRQRKSFVEWVSGEASTLSSDADWQEIVARAKAAIGSQATIKNNEALYQDKVQDVVSDMLREDGLDPAAPSATRGSVEFHDGATIIKVVSGKADLSTVLHELGHIFIRDLQKAVEANVGGDLAKRDLATLTEFAGGKLDRAGIEKLARAWEAWLREGRSPSAELGGAFERFRVWLVGIYKDIRGYVGADLNDDVRGVFERMLASDQEIDEARQYHEARGRLEDYAYDEKARSGKAPDEEFKELFEARAAADAETGAKAGKINVGPYLKALGGRKAFREAAEAAVDASPEFKALEAIRQIGGIKKADMVALVGEDAAEAIRKAHGDEVVTDLTGADPVALASIAAEHGFDSPEAMLTALAATATRREAVKAKQTELVEKAVEDFKQWTKTDMDVAGDAAWHNDARLALLLAERDFLRRRATKAETKQRAKVGMLAIKDEAKKIIGMSKVNESRQMAKWSAAEKRLASEAMRLAAAGDWDGAMIAKEKQAFNHALVLEAFNARERIDAFRRKYTSVRKMKASLEGVEYAYREAAKDLLTHYRLTDARELRPAVAGEILNLPGALAGDPDTIDFEHWAPDLASAFPEWIVNKRLPDGFETWRDMTIEQVGELENSLEAILRVGRGALSVLEDGKIKTVRDLADVSITAMQKRKPVKIEDDRFLVGKLKGSVRGFLLDNTVLDYVFDMLDGNPTILGKEEGPLKRMCRKVRECEVRQNHQMKKLLGRLEKPFDVLASFKARMREAYGAGTDKLTIPGLPVPARMQEVLGYKTWTVDQLVVAVLNTGNDANLYAMMEGYGLADLDIERLRGLFNQTEMDAVQEIWDTVESLWSETDAVTFRLTNKHPPKEQAQAFTTQTADGKIVNYRGGYFPLRYDGRLSDRMGAVMEPAKLQQMNGMQAVHGSMRPADGHAKARARDKDNRPTVKQPPQLSMRSLSEHLWNVTRYNTHAEALVEVDRLTRDEAWRNEVRRVMGDKVYSLIRRWLNYQSAPHKPGDDRLGPWLEYFRSMASISALGLNVKTGLKQRLGAFTAAASMSDASRTGKSGWGYLWKGMQSIGLKGGLGMDTEAIRAVYDASLLMEARATSFDREVKDQVMRLDPDRKEIEIAGHVLEWGEVKSAMFHWITMNDRAVACAVWRGAYLQAMDGNANFDPEGLTAEEREAKAKAYADSMALTQASGFSVDLTEMQRSAGLSRYLSMFLSGMNRFGSRMYQYADAYRQGQIDNGRLVLQLFREGAAMPWAWMGLTAALYMAAGDDEDMPEWWEWMLAPAENMIGWLPVVREIGSLAKYGSRNAGRVPAVSEPLQAVGDIGKGARKLTDGDFAAGAWDMWRGFEFFLGVPVSNVVRQAKQADKVLSGGDE